MLDTRSGAEPGAPAWRTYAGKRVTVHAPAGSYAAQRAPATLREAEQVVEALEKLLAPPAARPGERLDIYLTDPCAELPAALAGPPPPSGAAAGPDALPASTALVQVVQPEAPGEPLPWPLARRLIGRWFGANAATATLFVEGIAGVVAARIAAGPAGPAADDWVRQETAAGRPVSLFTRFAPGGPTPPPGGDLAATSFVAYLIESAGAGKLRQLLIGYDPTRRDQAVVATYGQPLGALEEAWRAGLRRPRRRGNANLQAFFRRLIPLLRPYAWRELEVLGYMLFGLTYGLVLPLSGKFLVDTVIPSRDLGQLGLFIAVLLVIYVLNTLLGTRRAYVNNWINQRILVDLQEKIFTYLQRLSHDFYAESKVGDIMSRLSNDLNVVQQAMAQVVGVGVYLTLTAIVSAVAVLTLNFLLGAIVLVVVPLFVLTYFVLRTRLEQAASQRQKLLGQAQTAVQENLTAQGVIKAFGLEEQAIAMYRRRLAALFSAAIRLVIFSSIFEASTGLAITLGQLLVLGVGGYLVIQGQLTVGTLLAFIGLLPSLFTPIATIASLGQTIQSASGALDRVFEILDQEVTVADQPAAVPLPPLAQGIQLDKVSFSYGGDRPILQDLALVIPAGEHVSLVGPSGSGKSTVLNLLLRFWDPAAGRVLFDGHDLRDVTLASLRGQIGIVFQDTFIFDTTLRENIAIGRPAATDAEIAAAAAAARLDSYVAALPAGYDTVLGERGVRMSGGQRQRLAIARVLLRDPRILILDEATSALDAETERGILDTLATVTPGRTTISITHRLTLAAMADRIFVLQGGQLIEEGPHAMLAHAGGLYQRLYDEQTGQATASGTPRPGADSDSLQTIPLFAGLGPPALGALAAQLAREGYPAEAVVVRQGEPGDKLYIIRRGQAEVVVAADAQERRVNLLNEGDYFGEMALLAGTPRAATVRTTQPTDFYSLSQADFVALLEREPSIRAAVTGTVTGRRTALAAVPAA
ncbi:MAG TPA: ABC transporter transmembrane domain-containing protein [Chloroflexia bacterium]|nr:ABC transporter transmembrane domain-containing protein [Chloroflexia bacterium]